MIFNAISLNYIIYPFRVMLGTQNMKRKKNMRQTLDWSIAVICMWVQLSIQSNALHNISCTFCVFSITHPLMYPVLFVQVFLLYGSDFYLLVFVLLLCKSDIMYYGSKYGVFNYQYFQLLKILNCLSQKIFH